MENEVKQLYLDDIIPNRFQPRENFDEQALKELAVSIKEHGVIQPIVVRQIGEKYEIIAGERRYKASTMAGLTQIPAIVKNLDDKESSKVALIENLQRRDLTPIEEARTYQKILELDALTQEDLARTMGKSQSAVSNKLRLLTLTDEVQDALLHEQISERHARSLLNITDPAKQVELLNKVINSRMTVRELDQEIKNMEGSGSAEIILDPQMQTIKQPGVNSNHIIEPVNPTVVDVDKIKTQSSDIFNPQQPSVNMNDLLKPQGSIPQNDSLLFSNNTIPTNTITESNTPEPPILNLNNNQNEEVIGGSGLLAGMQVADTIKPQNNISSDIPILNNNVDTEPVSNNLFPNPNQQVPDSTIKKIKDSIIGLKQQGNNIDIEEFDFDDFYQFVIRVNK